MDFLFNDDTITYPRSFRGAYTFSTLSNFLLGLYNNAGFTQTFAETVVSQGNPNVGAYAQDEWKVGSRLTLNAGVRYDVQFLESVNTDHNNVSPRFGVVLRYRDARNYYLCYRQVGGSSLVRIAKVVNGVETVLKSVGVPNPAQGTRFTLSCQVSGGALALQLVLVGDQAELHVFGRRIVLGRVEP